MNTKKLIGGIAKTAIGAGAAYIGVGGIICDAVLSRPMLNRTPEELLQRRDFLSYYHKYDNFRHADDWYVRKNPADIIIKNKDDVSLHCNIIEAEKPSHKWAVICHGYTSRPRQMAIQGKHYYDMGFNTLYPFMMAHRADKRPHTSMGYFEHLDVITFIEYIVTRDPEAEILIHGCSMGGAITMLVTGEDLPANVKAAVEDCGYTSAWDEFAAQIGNIMHLPEFPFLYAANTVAKTMLGWDFKKCAPVEAVAHSKTPTFFIHGEEDTFVPFSMLQKNYDACSAPKGILTVPGAEHDMSCLTRPDLYWPAVDEFIKQYI